MSNKAANGETGEISPKLLSTDEKLEILIEGVNQLSGQVEDLTNQLAETNEKLANITLSGEGFYVDDGDDN